MTYLLTVEDLTALLRVKKSWVYEQVKTGAIPKVPNMGRYIRFHPKEIKVIFGIDLSSSLKIQENEEQRP